jgi:hypothetical protein
MNAVSVVSARLAGLRTKVLPDNDPAQSAAPLASVIAALVVAATVAVGMRGGPVVHAGEARLELRGARVSIALAGHSFVSAHGSRTLHSGDRLRVLGGEPILRLVKGASAELRDGTALRVGTASGPQLTLEEGDLLATGPMSVGTIEATAAVTGVTRLAERAGLLAGVYRGTAKIRPTAAPQTTVHQYRQLDVAGLGVASVAVNPLHVDDTDRWDRRYLGEVIDLDGRLDSFSRGLDAQLPPGSGATPGFYRQLVPGLENENLPADVLEGRSPGENLVGFTLVALDTGSLDTRVEHIFGFRDEGARWGLVAADRGLSPSTVLNEFQAALGRVPSPSTAALPPIARATSPTRPRGTGGPGVTTTTRPSVGPPTTTTSTILPRTCTQPSTCVKPIDDGETTIEQILNGLLEQLPGFGGRGSSRSSNGLVGALLSRRLRLP